MGNYKTRLKKDHGQPLFHKRKSGQALIETAIIVPVIVVFLLGMVDVGRLIYTKIVITNAAREGANYLAYNSSDMAGSVQAARDEALNSGIPSMALGPVSISCNPSCTVDNQVEVTVTATLNGFLFKNVIITSNIIDMMIVQ